MTDLYYDKVSLLLPCTGVNAGTVIKDFSRHGATPSLFGNSQTKTDDFKYYDSCLVLDGSGDRLEFSNVDGRYNFTNKDYTIEFWVKLTGSVSSNTALVGSRRSSGGGANVALQVEQRVDGTIGVLAGTSSGYTPVGGTTIGTVPLSVWHHVANVRVGGTFYLFLNGVLQSTSSGTPTLNSLETPLMIGYDASTGGYAKAKMQDVRITIGQGRYTSDFTPPSRFIGSLLGVTRDELSDVVSRLIRAHPKLPAKTYFEIMSSAIDGTFILPVPITPMYVIGFDDGDLEAIIYDNLLPA